MGRMVKGSSSCVASSSTTQTKKECNRFSNKNTIVLSWIYSQKAVLTSKQESSQEEYGRNHANVVPRSLEWIVQGGWKQQQPKAEESGSVSVIDQRHWRREQSFTATKIILKDGKRFVHLIFSHEVHW